MVRSSIAAKLGMRFSRSGAVECARGKDSGTGAVADLGSS